MRITTSFFVLFFTCFAFGQDTDKLKSAAKAFQFRLVGPALTSGRVSDIAIDPRDENTWYVTAASGGVWKTSNHGITFQAIFDHYGSYSIGCVSLAPSNSNTVWIGTGENNNQRSVAYGDGVYKSLDGGKSFENVGLKESEHIGNIIIHPTDENTVWVAAYGPVWSAGGERGVYKTTDGGETWEQTLFVSENTGIAEIKIDPSNPNILYASAHQRRRREWTYIGGGPESGLYKSTDGGETWRKINNGLPEKDMGRIGIAVSPADPNYVYAIVEARKEKNGFYRSTNKGESWQKMSGYSTSGNYYQEIICDLNDKDKVFSMNTWLHHTEDGGKTFQRTGESNKHVDNHCIWIDPNNSEHWIVGCDGGIYETFNHAKDWKFYSNLPIIQFYKVATDNAKPFYNIYGGTQDNNSMGGPSATINNAGILNSDWYITNGGDGFESAIDPTNPNIVYAQAQYGWLVRYDKASGERVPIQPMPGKDEEGYRWNWDAPLLISPHDNKTLYFAANKLFKSENQGDDWETVSPDLTQQIDRNKLPVMGQVWSMDAVMKNKSTTIYGNIVALDESPIKEGLLYVGTDDGLIQVSKNGGDSWQKISSVNGVPKNTRVNMIYASPTDENVVYAVFNNHRAGDFKPYLYMSKDKGTTWQPIAGDLPKRGSAYCILQDFENENLLFAGTEFGAYFSIDKGESWTKLSGLPTIAVYDLAIQKRESDLVAGTFGRGFYVLDNYAPLRELSDTILEKDAHLFSTKDALLYIPSNPLGSRGKSSQGANLWTAPNPTFGATFNLYLKEGFTSLKAKRQKEEAEKEKNGEDVFYPSFEEIEKEKLEEKPQLVWIIRDASGKEIRRFSNSLKKGVNQATWNLRRESTSPVKLQKRKPGRYSSPDVGLLVVPGKYQLDVWKVTADANEQIITNEALKVVGLNNQTLLAENPTALNSFRSDVAIMTRKLNGSVALFREYSDKLKLLEQAITHYPNAELNFLKTTKDLKIVQHELQKTLWGNRTKRSLEFEIAPGLTSRLGILEYQLFSNTTGVTKSQKENLKTVREIYAPFRVQLDNFIQEMEELDKKLQDNGIPYIKGQDDSWKED